MLVLLNKFEVWYLIDSYRLVLHALYFTTLYNHLQHTNRETEENRK